ncbi:RING-type E3 ubiquitin-protein ligase PPIL2 [Oratosquilla oratoria]|uniref:RING-type E3 ubiquitin-protein ligase PPIL2 n=1 Tax=Oratosquilla oratoria TaxID=337810 RepID=UPI003F761BBF
MGKRQHQKDKMYLTSTEWSTLYGGYKASSHSGANANFRRLPLTHCALSLQPFTHPYCDQHGNLYDLEAVLPFLRKFKINPVTGEPLSEKQLIKLTFHKASTGEYHCPVMYKPLTNNTHVVAIRTTGNVFSYEAIDQLNLKNSNWKELLTDDPFERSDIITIQDSNNLDKFNISEFHHIKKNLKIEDEESVKARSDAAHRLKSVSQDTKFILDEFNRTYKEPEKTNEEKQKSADRFNAAHYSTGKVAASFTSTSVDVETQHEAAVLDDAVVRYQRVKKKGYVSLKTNLGSLNLELYCDTVSKACENFIRLCSKGYYNGTIFHRSIRHFMIQGGDPTGTGKGGDSFWGGSFKDQFRPNLSHTGRGVLSMANSGPNTNKSQFFITFRSCAHLDGKHTIFGRAVGGLTTLSAMEAVETDNKDRPVEDIVIEAAAVFVDPFKEADVELAKERVEEAEKRKQEEEELKSRKRPKKDESLKVFRSGVGMFLDLEKAKPEGKDVVQAAPQKKKNATYGFKERMDSKILIINNSLQAGWCPENKHARAATVSSFQAATPSVKIVKRRWHHPKKIDNSCPQSAANTIWTQSTSPPQAGTWSLDQGRVVCVPNVYINNGGCQKRIFLLSVFKIHEHPRLHLKILVDEGPSLSPAQIRSNAARHSTSTAEPNN